MLYNRSAIIVDDSESDRLLFARYLNQIGLTCTCYENAEKLIAGFDSHESGFILMDIELPGISGFEAARILKEKQKNLVNKHLIIALTAHSGSAFMKKLAESGFDDCFQKPISKKEMQKKLSGYLIKDSDLTKSDSKNCVELGISQGKLYSLDMFDADEPEFIRSIVEMFVNDTPVSLKAIRDAVENDKMDELKFNAHKLKPHFGFFGALKVQQAMQRIEDIGRGLEAKDDLADLLACVEHNSAMIIAQLEKDILA